MAGRIFWIGVAGAALSPGWWFRTATGLWHCRRIRGFEQDRSSSRPQRRSRRRPQCRQNTDHRPRRTQIDVPPESKRDFADAVGRLVKAEADLCVLRVRDGNRQERAAARARRDHARAEVETLKDAIEQHEKARRSPRTDSRQRPRRCPRDRPDPFGIEAPSFRTRSGTCQLYFAVAVGSRIASAREQHNQGDDRQDVTHMLKK